MSQSSGAYGEADATEQKNEQHNNQPANSASTDATLSARAKSPKSKGPDLKPGSTGWREYCGRSVAEK